VDLHVHLLAGLDDGPRTWDDALSMCQIAFREGVRHASALAHQSDRWNVSVEQIRFAVQELRDRLRETAIGIEVFPSAEVMAVPDLDDVWYGGSILSVGDRGQFLLVEMPHRLCVDLRGVVRRLASRGVRIVLAHPERHPELLNETGRIEELIRLGCLVQVSSSSITEPIKPADEAALRDWFRRGCVHVLGSDGHSPRSRKPLMAAAFRRLEQWIGNAAARQICAETGLAILRGQPVPIREPEPARRSWRARLVGSR
jgi:protein-tyrosine phosphatase